MHFVEQSETSGLAAAISRDGYACGPRILDDDDADRLAAECLDLVGRTDGAQRLAAAGASTEPFLHMPRPSQHSAAVAELLTNQPLVDAACASLDAEEVQLFEDHLFVKPPHQPLVRGWHQDTTYLPFRPPYRGVGAWIALTDAPVDSGAMQMITGSHRWEVPPIDTGTSLSLDELPAQARQAAIAHRPVPKGTVHFHDPAVVHGSAGNLTASPRVAISVFFVNAGAVGDTGGPFSAYFDVVDGEPLDLDRHPILTRRRNGAT